jgi:hypothetical protein
MSSGMSLCVVGSIAQDVLKGHSAFIFRVRQSKTQYSHAGGSGYVSPHTHKTTFLLALLHAENEGSITLQSIRNYNPSDIE